MSRKTDMIRNGGYMSHNLDTGESKMVIGLDAAIDSIKVIVNSALDYADRIEEENTKLKNGQWKDEKLADMRERCEAMQKDMWRGFPISEKEYDEIDRWRKHHVKRHEISNKTKLSGPTFSYTFTPSVVGTLGVIRCEECMNKLRKELGNEGSDYAYFKKFEELNDKYDAEYMFQRGV